MPELEKTEKITINLGPLDLGQIDLLVQEGFYANRTDFIRTAIRNQLMTHSEVVKRTVARKTLVLGIEHYSCSDLEAVRAAGERLEIRVLGLVSIDDDVSPELARDTIDSIEVLGALRASPAVCWRWFQEADQQREQGEPSLIAGMTREIVNHYNVSDQQVCIAGLSAGGAMAAIMAATYPNLYAAVGVHSGLPYGAAHDLHSVFAVMQQGAIRYNKSVVEAIPLIIFHGDADTTFAPINADQLADQWLAASERGSGTKQRRDSRRIEGQIAGGHNYTRTIYRDRYGETIVEKWMVHQAGHAWAGGSSNGSYTDTRGPDASKEMLRFFAEHPKKR